MAWWLVLLLLVGALLLLALLGGLFLFHFALNPRLNKRRVFGASHNALRNVEDMRRLKDQGRLWWDAMPTQQVALTSADGLRLVGHLLPAPAGSRKWAIVCHGYTSQGLHMVDMAQAYYQAGYGVLLPDLRGHGQSQGRYIGMGWPDRLDLLLWVDHILQREPQAHIVLHGVSMGAATVMMAAGEALPTQVVAITADCGYGDLWQLFSYQLKGIFGLPPFPIMHIADWFARRLAGYGMREASTLKQLEKARVPVLFIHGEKDTFVPFHMLQQVYAACASPKQQFPVANAGHAGSAAVAGEAYWQRVFSFIHTAQRAE